MMSHLDRIEVTAGLDTATGLPTWIFEAVEPDGQRTIVAERHDLSAALTEASEWLGDGVPVVSSEDAAGRANGG